MVGTDFFVLYNGSPINYSKTIRYCTFENEMGGKMKTAVVGFPRVGTLRELKFASEKYFRGEITAEELMETAKQ